MRWSDIPFSPTAATLRTFAGAGLLVLGGLACWQGFVQGNATVALVLGGLALGIGVVGLTAPLTLRPVFVGLMVLSFPLSWTISHLTLAVLFYCFITPLGLVFKFLGRDVLGRRFLPNQDTYWTAKSSSDDLRSYFRQS